MRTAKFLPLLAILPMAAPIARPQIARPRIKAVDPTPATARPQGATALSTAQSGGAHDGVRLRSLPALTATQADDTPVQVASVTHSEYWLLLYRGLQCVPCDHALESMTKSSDTALRSGTGLVVLVGSGTPGARTGGGDRLGELRTRYNKLGNAVWLYDRQGTAQAALKPKGVPMLYAMHGSTVAWSAPGVLGDGKTLATMASAWVARNPAPNKTPVPNAGTRN